MRIIYISSTTRIDNPLLDPSVRYRCFNFAKKLSEDPSILVDITSFAKFHQLTIECYDIFIFHRPSMSEKLEAIIRNLIKLGKKFYCDYDDLVFNPQYAESMSTFKNNRASLEEVRQTLANNQLALRLFKDFFVSTEPLLSHVKHIHPEANVTVIPNSITDKWLAKSKIVSTKRNTKEKIIGYFCGTLSHNLDFKLIEEHLFNVLLNNQDAKLLLIGPLEVSKRIPSERIIRKNVVPFYDMPHLIAECDLTIAPLENSIFNNSKSAIKFLESMSVGVPCLVSPTPDMLRHLDNGVIICEEHQWSTQIQKYLQDAEEVNEKINLFELHIEKLKVGIQAEKLKHIFQKERG